MNRRLLSLVMLAMFFVWPYSTFGDTPFIYDGIAVSSDLERSESFRGIEFFWLDNSVDMSVVNGIMRVDAWKVIGTDGNQVLLEVMPFALPLVSCNHPCELRTSEPVQLTGLDGDRLAHVWLWDRRATTRDLTVTTQIDYDLDYQVTDNTGREFDLRRASFTIPEPPAVLLLASVMVLALCRTPYR